MSTVHPGRCHCGTLTVAFESTHPLDQLPVRQCGCSFCLRHNPRYTSDPGGRVTLTCNQPALHYRFGHESADFVMCPRCGVFVAALWAHEERLYAVINLLALDERAAFTAESRLMDFDSETPTERTSRRAASWTPAHVT